MVAYFNSSITVNYKSHNYKASYNPSNLCVLYDKSLPSLVISIW